MQVEGGASVDIGAIFFAVFLIVMVVCCGMMIFGHLRSGRHRSSGEDATGDAARRASSDE